MMFTDDIALCNESKEEVEKDLEMWSFALERRAMRVSPSKTKEYSYLSEVEEQGSEDGRARS